MKYLLLILGIVIGSHSFAQITLIPDEEFEMFLILNAIDTDFTINGQVNTADIENITELIIDQALITDLTGIEDFAALEILRVSFTDLTFLDVSENINLKELFIPHNALTSLELVNNPALEILVCGNPEEDVGPFNQITAIDFSGAPNLLHLDVSIMFVDIAFDLSQLPLLEYFNGSYCLFTSLDFSSNPNLEVLNLGGYETGLVFGQSNNLTEIDVSGNPNLETLNVRLTNISALNLKNGNNEVLTTMFAEMNEPLFCIQVDDETAANNGDAPYGSWNVDPQVSYSEECILGIAENELESFTLYPNPASQTIQIVYSNGVTPKDVAIYSVAGHLLLQSSFNTTSINISNLASGLYILKAQIDQGISTRTFIKQ